MRYKWLNKEGKEELIIFFNGWGMDESVVSHLDFDSFDVLMFNNYISLQTDFDFSLLKKYKKVYIVAWSMGVMIATLFDIKVESATAINGTLFPINDSYGIPERIYDLTIKNFNDLTLKKFINNMFNADSVLPKINRNSNELKEELVALKNYKSNETFKYDKIFISKNDKIIPTKNQIAFWGNNSNLDSGHAVLCVLETGANFYE